MLGILGKKIGMTQIFEDGKFVPVTVVEAGPILFRIPAMSAPVFDNIEAAIKDHGLS